MSDLLPYAHNFVAVHAFEAVYSTDQDVYKLLIEMRISADGKILLFTMVNGKQVRSNSIQEFILSQPQSLSLSIAHSIQVLWDKVVKRAEIHEIYVPIQGSDHSVGVKIRLVVDDTIYETEECDTLTEAVMELKELIGSQTEWWLQTCHHCLYGYPAFLGPGWDDRNELQCYRDAPNEFAEIQQKGRKFVSQETREAGQYFVHAFHTCAAWRKPN